MMFVLLSLCFGWVWCLLICCWLMRLIVFYLRCRLCCLRWWKSVKLVWRVSLSCCLICLLLLWCRIWLNMRVFISCLKFNWIVFCWNWMWYCWYVILRLLFLIGMCMGLICVIYLWLIWWLGWLSWWLVVRWCVMCWLLMRCWVILLILLGLFVFCLYYSLVCCCVG